MRYATSYLYIQASVKGIYIQGQCLYPSDLKILGSTRMTYVYN
ncbi:hypothetical protein THOG11_10473 [Vibrio harveyi]|nr:hypothetical protein TH15OA1_200281 [Vibrio harveyi]CAH1528874.1 hypothetical protein VHARVF571_200150 [Vibrio harveyi]CAH1547936.1 hypothetical protein THOD03_10474 [Vibrio harveyi]CAH1550100.1 hypothetical protein THOG11_10473 [Vibrio harveyi]